MDSHVPDMESKLLAVQVASSVLNDWWEVEFIGTSVGVVHLQLTKHD